MVFLDPFYLALGVFVTFVLVTLITSACIRKVRNRRRLRAHPQPPVSYTISDPEGNHQLYHDPVNLYEAKANFNYDPDLLPLSGNKSIEDSKQNGLSYLTRLPDNNLSIALEQNYYEAYTKR